MLCGGRWAGTLDVYVQKSYLEHQQMLLGRHTFLTRTPSTLPHLLTRTKKEIDIIAVVGIWKVCSRDYTVKSVTNWSVTILSLRTFRTYQERTSHSTVSHTPDTLLTARQRSRNLRLYIFLEVFPKSEVAMDGIARPYEKWLRTERCELQVQCYVAHVFTATHICTYHIHRQAITHRLRL